MTAVVDNKVAGEREIIDGKYGQKRELIVQVGTETDKSKQISFFINGLKAKEEANLLDSSGQVIEKDLTITEDPWTDFPKKTVPKVGKNRLWTVELSKELKDIKEERLQEGITVYNEKDEKINVALEIGKDKKTILVKPPASGYKAGNYTLYVANLISADDLFLSKAVKMDFIVE